LNSFIFSKGLNGGVHFQCQVVSMFFNQIFAGFGGDFANFFSRNGKLANLFINGDIFRNGVHSRMLFLDGSSPPPPGGWEPLGESLSPGWERWA